MLISITFTIMDINKIIKKIRDLREEMAAAGVPTNNASSGNIAGLPPDSPPVKTKKKLNIWRKGITVKCG